MRSSGQIRPLSLTSTLQANSLGSVVTAVPVANLYAEPSEDAELISQSIYGFELRCLEAQGEWIRVCAADAYAGWARHQHFLTGEAATSPRVRVNSLSANVYREPDIKARAALLRLPWEARLHALSSPESTTDRWMEVQLLDDTRAFVFRGDLTFDEPLLTPAQMLALAHRFLGTTYTWGGISTFGFDCSGLMQTLHRQRGLVLPRDAQAQCDWPGFFEVPPGHLLPGDLLFFTDNPPAVTHVGLSLGGETFLHCTTEGHPGVQISLLSEYPWHTRLCAQRRLRA